MKLSPILSKNVVALIMAGGRGSRLGPLTNVRSKPAVYFGGKFRIIDFTLSNCVNSGIKKIGVLTQYKAHSLIRHLQNAWSFFSPSMGEFIEYLPASQMRDESMWYRGTADSIAQNLSIIKGYNAKYFIILAGDHIYKMDYIKMVEFHIAKKATCTVSCITIPRKGAEEFGVMGINKENKIVNFVEKSSQPPTLPNDPNKCMASMGIYVFDRDTLFDILSKDIEDDTSSHDFGKDIIPYCVQQGNTYAFPFEEGCVRSTDEASFYWKDVGTIDAFWQANIDLTMPLPELDIYDRSWPILTHQYQLPPAKFLYNEIESKRQGSAVDSLVSGGCIISGSHVNRSVLFPEVRVNSYAYVKRSILFPNVEIGRHSEIQNTIIDKECFIPPNSKIGFDLALDRQKYHVSSSGVVLITKDML